MWRSARGYAAALAVTALMVLLRWALDPLLDDRYPLTLLFAAIAYAALLDGAGPALVSATAGYAAVNYFFVEPRGTLGWSDAAQFAGFVAYTFVAAIIIGLAHYAARQRDALMKSEELQRVSLASIGDAVITTSVQGNITFLNPVAEELTGWRTAEVLGQPIESVFRVVNDNSGAPAENPALRAMREGRIVGLANHTLLIRKDGSQIPIDDSGAPIRIGDGPPIGSVLVFRDISDHNAAQQKLIEADRLKNRFLAVVAHELRNPLSAIANAAEALKRSIAEPERFMACHGIIERQVTQLTLLLDDLAEISRMSENKLVLHLEAAPLQRALDQAIEAAKPAIEARQHRFSARVPKEPLVATIDVPRMAQAVCNLLVNAAKYTPPGGDIELSLERVGPNAVIRVRDNGIGIAPEDQQEVFRLFSQLATAAGGNPGLGIGLALVRDLVTRHKGRVEVRSEGRGKGSEFRIELPLA